MNKQFINNTQNTQLNLTVQVFTSGYATMVYGRGRNPHRSTTTFADLEITSL